VLTAMTDKIASVNPSLGALTVGAIASASAARVWAADERTVTSGLNIVLSKGVGLLGLNDLSAAQVNAEADTALADVGLTTTVTGRIDAPILSRLAATAYTAPFTPAQMWENPERSLTDRSGFALAQAFPANFDRLGIRTAASPASSWSTPRRPISTCAAPITPPRRPRPSAA
jgi:hypothetical protein